MAKTIPGFKFIQSAGGISEYRLLKNDLTVLIKEEHFSPTATIMVTYRVGSRNEVTGITGSTHILEHMLFKGSKKFNKKTKYKIDSLGDLGAQWNATTWFDRTNYYETLPVEHLPLAIEMEADRMRNAFLIAEDLKTEMTVVRNEFERGENEQGDLLGKEVWAAAFIAHPYHHDTIGWRSDIENANVEKLKKFYDTFYWPNNATVTLIGDFETKKILELVKKYFGEHSRAPKPIPEMNTIEPEQYGERRVIVRRASEPNIVSISWKIPHALHVDTHAIQVLASLLADGKSSVLHRALVDSGLATSATVQHALTHDPGLFSVDVALTPGTKHEEVEKIILHSIAPFKKAVDKKALSRAKRILELEAAFGRDGSYAEASWINTAIAVGDWTFYTTFMKSIENVEPHDIVRVANTYFVPSKIIIGHYESTNQKHET